MANERPQTKKNGKQTSGKQANAQNNSEAELIDGSQQNLKSSITALHKWVGLTKPLATSLNPTSKHSSHLRKSSKGDM